MWPDPPYIEMYITQPYSGTGAIMLIFGIVVTIGALAGTLIETRTGSIETRTGSIETRSHARAMKALLVERYGKEGYTYPELLLENRLKQKVDAGKTEEQALQELLKESEKSP
jgi:hypothetical protein